MYVITYDSIMYVITYTSVCTIERENDYRNQVKELFFGVFIFGGRESKNK